MDTIEPKPPFDPSTSARRRRETRRAAGLDEAWNRRLAAARLVRDAAARTDLRADVSSRSNVLGLLCAMFVLNGDRLSFHRGWVEAFREAFKERGLPVPNPAVVRCYRSHLQENSFRFATTALVDVEVLARIEAKYLA